MRLLSFTLLLLLHTLTAFADERPAQDPTPGSIARRSFNQVFVKVIMPVTEHTPKQDGPVVESWVAEQLKQLGASEYFAVTNWVQICDGLLADDEVNNDVWRGSLGQASFCAVGGDLPERNNGRVLVSVSGWSPGGAEARVTLADEPGTRAVEPALHHSANGEKRQIPGEKPIAYVAILIAPPAQAPQEGVTSHSDAK
jgi:hypothetical protein